MTLKKLMIVDDEKLICWALSKVFSKDCFDEVVCFNSGEQALTGMREDPADAMILDVRLPGISGIEVLDEVRRLYPDTKVIMISAYGTAEVHKRAEELGVLGFFDKPLNLAALKEALCAC